MELILANNGADCDMAKSLTTSMCVRLFVSSMVRLYLVSIFENVAVELLINLKNR